MFTDVYRKKTYWAKPGDFLVNAGNRLDGWVLKDELISEERELTEDNESGTFTIAGQRVEYKIERDGESNFNLNFKTPSASIQVVARSLPSINIILYKIAVIDNMRSPPIAKLHGKEHIYFATIESYLKEIDMDGYFLYTSPQVMIYCS